MAPLTQEHSHISRKQKACTSASLLLAHFQWKSVNKFVQACLEFFALMLALGSRNQSKKGNFE